MKGSGGDACRGSRPRNRGRSGRPPGVVRQDTLRRNARAVAAIGYDANPGHSTTPPPPPAAKSGFSQFPTRIFSHLQPPPLFSAPKPCFCDVGEQ